MRRAGIALVAVETVLRVAQMQFEHAPVAHDFRQDRCGHDRRFDRVAADDRLGRAGQAGRQAVAVDARAVGGRRQARQRAAHAGERGLQDVQGVDFVGFHEFDPPCQRAFDDQRIQRLAPGFGELLGVVQAVDRAVRIEDHRRHRHRAGQRAAAGFVHAGDAQRPHARDGGHWILEQTAGSIGGRRAAPAHVGMLTARSIRRPRPRPAPMRRSAAACGVP